MVGLSKLRIRFFYGEEVLSFEEGEYCFSLFFSGFSGGSKKSQAFCGSLAFFIGVLGTTGCEKRVFSCVSYCILDRNMLYRRYSFPYSLSY